MTLPCCDDILETGDRMKTLYVSDLDGTLLHSDQRTSEYTNKVIGELVDKGLLFSYATARSYSTASKAAAGLTAAFPVIVYNGTFIRDNATGRALLENLFDKARASEVAADLISCGVQPIVYSLIGGEERFSYIEKKISDAERDFIATRKGDCRDRPIGSFDQLTEGRIFYFTCIDQPQKLRPFYEKYKDEFNCYYQSDIYTGEWWLEIMPKSASKANAVRQLAKLLGCCRIVAFGDGINDIALFEAADESYAVSNACDELKRIADGVIGSNDDDGVAKFLLERCK